MNPTETFPHRRARDERYRHYCACGDSVPEEMFKGVGSPLSPSYTWGSDCPAALREALEVERARMSGPHIPPALMRRIEALGFVPGSGEPVGWLVAHAEELEATLANERGEGQPPSEGWTVIRNPMLPGDPNGWFWERRFAMVYRDGARNGPWVANVYHPTEGVRVSRHFTARAAMSAAFEALAARSSAGGAS